jgi:ABC-type sugar transport system permease subunit
VRPYSASKRRVLDRFSALLFVAPVLAATAFFVYVPVVEAVKLSFYSWDGLSPKRYVGLANYRFILEFPEFRRIFVNNLVLVGGVAVWITLPFIAAVVLMNLKGARAVRTIIFIPVLLPPLVVGSMFRIIFSSQGPVNGLLRSVGLGSIALNWLTDSNLVLLSVIVMISWATIGTGVLFYSAGLASIPSSFFEAASIDGANWRQVVWHVVRPLLTPTTYFWALVLTISTVTAFFPWIFGLTNGGPGVASTTIDYRIYTSAIQNAQFGLACALAVVAVLFLWTLIALQFGIRWVMKRL